MQMLKRCSRHNLNEIKSKFVLLKSIRVTIILYRNTIDIFKQLAVKSRWLIDGSQHLTSNIIVCLTKNPHNYKVFFKSMEQDNMILNINDCI